METGYILGLSCGFHDSAVALLRNGEVIAAVEEERFTGIKHDASFPKNSIDWIFKKYNISSDKLNAICFYEQPLSKIDRIKKSTKRGGILNTLKRHKIISRNVSQYKSFQNEINNIKGKNTEVIYINHHDSHAAYSYYTSPFDEATILCVDGVGEWDTTTTYYGKENKLVKLSEIHFPHSLGMLYSTFTAFLGFKPNEGEYKVMGLAPYGDYKKYLSKFSQLITPTIDGGFELNMKYFTFDWSDTNMFNAKLSKLFNLPNRLPNEELTQDYKDLAATLQHEYEYYFFRLLDKLYSSKPTQNLCLGGGSAYNGTANGKVIINTNYENLWIPPAPSDAGSAIGCALYYHYIKNSESKRIQNTNPYLGPSYSKDDIKKVLDLFSKEIYYVEKLDDELLPIVARQIVDGNVIGWFEGRLEFGARALGHRSILANPCDPEMKSRVNRVIKKREGFRPFAPIVRWEDQNKFFEYPYEVPYMNQVVKVHPNHQKNLPAITHIDGTARIQSLKRNQQPRIYKLLSYIEKLNGYPIILNTSFNLKDQTMVNDPKTTIETFLNCEMDTLVLENFIIKKRLF